MRWLQTVALALAGIVIAGSAASEEPILSVVTTDAVAQFDLDRLAEMPQVEISTTTIWTEGNQSFVGVPLLAFFEGIPVNSNSVRATALNDYSVEIPLDDPSTSFALVAHHRNGETMSVRDKGPLWIVYPYDDHASLQSEIVHARSIWQLRKLELLPAE